MLVYGEDDADAASGGASITRAVDDGLSASQFRRAADTPLSVAVTDNETAAFVLSQSTVQVAEGAEAAYTVLLSHVPTGAVRVLQRSGNAEQARVSPTAGGPYAREWSLMTFTASTWNTAQTVYVEGRQDTSPGSVTIEHTAYAPESADEYAALVVTVTISATVGGNATGALTFTAGNWATGQAGTPAVAWGRPAELAADVTVPLVGGRYGFGPAGAVVDVAVGPVPREGVRFCLPVLGAVRAAGGGVAAL